MEIGKREWQGALEKVKLDRVAEAINRCKCDYPWPPSLPEFFKLCTEGDFPSVHEAYKEACIAAYPNREHNWTHPAIFHTAHHVGLRALLEKPESQTRKLFEHAYEITCRRIREGESLILPIPKCISQKDPVKSSKEVAERYLAKMRTTLKEA